MTQQEFYEVLHLGEDPTDYYNTVNKSLRPEQRLWFGVLLDALEEIGAIKYTNDQRTISVNDWVETIQWINDECDEEGGFDWILHTCDINISPQEFKRKLNNMVCNCCGVNIMQWPCMSVVRVHAHKENKNK